MTFGNASDIEAALLRLGKKLAYDYAEPISLVVCGGSALNVLNIANRTTTDVDVLAIVEEKDGRILLRHDKPLPESLCTLVAEVGRDLRLEEGWLNMGPKSVLDVWGIPEGMTDRWERREYGPSLTVYFVGRHDQVHFKVLAAADPSADPKHLEDLTERIRPTEEEVRAAVSWLLARDHTTPWIRSRVRQVVKALGYENIAQDIPA